MLIIITRAEQLTVFVYPTPPLFYISLLSTATTFFCFFLASDVVCCYGVCQNWKSTSISLLLTGWWGGYSLSRLVCLLTFVLFSYLVGVLKNAETPLDLRRGQN